MIASISIAGMHGSACVSRMQRKYCSARRCKGVMTRKAREGCRFRQVVPRCKQGKQVLKGKWCQGKRMGSRCQEVIGP